MDQLYHHTVRRLGPIRRLLGGMSNVYLEQAYPIVKHSLERFLIGRFDEMINRVTHEPAHS